MSTLKRSLTERNPKDVEEEIAKCKKQLEAAILETEELSKEFETPSKAKAGGRFNILDGGDPSEEELAAKLSMLQRLIEKKKELLMGKDIAVKETLAQIRLLEKKSRDWNEETQLLLSERNEYIGRILEQRRLHTSQKSELRMYDELIEAGMARMAVIKNDIELREQLAAETRNGKERVRDVPVETSSPDHKPHNNDEGPRHERPTAYIPHDDEATAIKVPRPVSKRFHGLSVRMHFTNDSLLRDYFCTVWGSCTICAWENSKMMTYLFIP